jgi:hypothetical protein
MRLIIEGTLDYCDKARELLELNGFEVAVPQSLPMEIRRNKILKYLDGKEPMKTGGLYNVCKARFYPAKYKSFRRDLDTLHRRGLLNKKNVSMSEGNTNLWSLK